MIQKKNLYSKKKTVLSCKNIIWFISFILVGVAVIIDVLPMYQICYLKEQNGHTLWMVVYNIAVKVFDYELSVLNDILIVIWTFTVSLGSIFLEKIDQKFYGIRIGTLIHAKGYKHFLMNIVVSAIIQLVVLIFGGVFQLKVTLFANCIYLFVTMVIFFYFIAIDLSRIKIIQSVKDELNSIIEGKTELKNALILNSVINNLDYKDKEDIQILNNFLKEDITEKIKTKLEKEDVDNKWEFNKIEDLSYGLVYHISFTIVEEMELIEKKVITDWFDSSEVFAIRVGILSAVLDKETRQGIEFANQLVKAMKNSSECRKLRIWMIVYELHQSMDIGQEWRARNAEYLFQEYIRKLSTNDNNDFWKCWCTLNKDTAYNFILFEFLSTNAGGKR